MSLFINCYRIATQLFAANRTVNHIIITTCFSTCGLHIIFNHCFTFNVTRQILDVTASTFVPVVGFIRDPFLRVAVCAVYVYAVNCYSVESFYTVCGNVLGEGTAANGYNTICENIAGFVFFGVVIRFSSEATAANVCSTSEAIYTAVLTLESTAGDVNSSPATDEVVVVVCVSDLTTVYGESAVYANSVPAAYDDLTTIDSQIAIYYQGVVCIIVCKSYGVITEFPNLLVGYGNLFGESHVGMKNDGLTILCRRYCCSEGIKLLITNGCDQSLCSSFVATAITITDCIEIVIVFMLQRILVIVFVGIAAITSVGSVALLGTSRSSHLSGIVMGSYVFFTAFVTLMVTVSIHIVAAFVCNPAAAVVTQVIVIVTIHMRGHIFLAALVTVVVAVIGCVAAGGHIFCAARVALVVAVVSCIGVSGYINLIAAHALMPVVSTIGLPCIAVAMAHICRAGRTTNITSNIAIAVIGVSDRTNFTTGVTIDITVIVITMTTFAVGDPHIAISVVIVGCVCLGAAGVHGAAVAVGQQDGVHLDIHKARFCVRCTLLDAGFLDYISVEFNHAGFPCGHNACMIGSCKNRAIHDQGAININLSIRHVTGCSDARGCAFGRHIGDRNQFRAEAVGTPVGGIHQINLVAGLQMEFCVLGNIDGTSRLQHQVLIHRCGAGIDVDGQILLQGQHKVLCVVAHQRDGVHGEIAIHIDDQPICGRVIILGCLCACAESKHTSIAQEANLVLLDTACKDGGIANQVCAGMDSGFHFHILNIVLAEGEVTILGQVSSCATAAVVRNLHLFIDGGTGIGNHLGRSGAGDIAPGIQGSTVLQHDLGAAVHFHVTVILIGRSAVGLAAMGSIVEGRKFNITGNIQRYTIGQGQSPECLRCIGSAVSIFGCIPTDGIRFTIGIGTVVGDQKLDAGRNFIVACGQRAVAHQHDNFLFLTILGIFSRCT